MDWSEQLVRCAAKAKKSGSWPIGQPALQAIEKLLEHIRSPRSGRCRCFLQKPGNPRRFQPDFSFAAIETVSGLAGLDPGLTAAQAAHSLRDAHARRGRGLRSVQELLVTRILSRRRFTRT